MDASTGHAGAPIAVFDSGVGGLSVLREIRSRLPREHLLYFADSAWAPYGDRTLAEVRERAVAVTQYLLDQGAKAIVVACNSASAAALHHLRIVFPDVPFVGMEPAVKPAAAISSSGVIGVLATTATFQSELFASVIERHSNGARVVAVAAPGLADLVEQGAASSAEAKALLTEYVHPMIDQGIDTLVLGCTHYPFLLPLLQTVVGEGVAVIDPSPAVARQVGRVVDRDGLRAPSTQIGTARFLTSGEAAVFATRAGALLGETLTAVTVTI